MIAFCLDFTGIHVFYLSICTHKSIFPLKFITQITSLLSSEKKILMIASFLHCSTIAFNYQYHRSNQFFHLYRCMDTQITDLYVKVFFQIIIRFVLIAHSLLCGSVSLIDNTFGQGKSHYRTVVVENFLKDCKIQSRIKNCLYEEKL